MSKRFWMNRFSEPSTRDLPVDDPRTTALRTGIIREKKFLHQIYVDWYREIAATIPGGGGAILEIGSGGGFFKEICPAAITSEILAQQKCDVVLNAFYLPFAQDALKSISMINVLHHFPQPRQFFHEASRCVREGGVVVLVEPWVTPWSAFMYGHFHSEPFSPDAPTWEFESSGPVSGANEALPWIIFSRDRLVFEHEFPEWRIDRITPIMPFRYLISGGVSVKSLMPGWSYKPVKFFERLFNPLMRFTAMFAVIVLTRGEKEPA